MMLKDFGEEGQRRMSQAKVLVIGAGGLGCPVLQYITGAGIGTIGIVDGDEVELSNLHRQPLFTTDDIGSPKAIAAATHLKNLNPEIEIITYADRLDTGNALEILSKFDIIVDGTDNFPTRYLINDACVLLRKPLVYGAVSQFEGQVAVFNASMPGNEWSSNYRDLFPEPPAKGEVQNCEEAGVLGILPGIIGIMQATEVIKLITGLGTPLINRLLTYDAFNNTSFEVELEARKQAYPGVPDNQEAFEAYDYSWHCKTPDENFEIDSEYFDDLVRSKDTVIIDVRELNELPIITDFPHQKIPLGQLQEIEFDPDLVTVILFCQTGRRSLEGVRLLSRLAHGPRNIFSLRNGIVAWKRLHQNKKSV
jgi:sulfur-carrier protein adenylyltransferase/sulfurtransferase